MGFNKQHQYFKSQIIRQRKGGDLQFTIYKVGGRELYRKSQTVNCKL